MERIDMVNARTPLILLIAAVFFFATLGLPPLAISASINLEWQPSLDDDLAGYKVYYQANSTAQPFTGTGAAEGSSPIDVADATTATITGLDPGKTYYFAVIAYNTAGRESLYSEIMEVGESIPPAVMITSPTASTVSGMVAISATASDNISVQKVEFYVNDQLKAVSSAAPYSVNWDTSSLSPGNYTLVARAYDVAGNIGNSQPVVVNVTGDVSPPLVILTAPITTTSVTGNVAVMATASDNIGVTKVEIYDNSVLIYSGDLASVTYTWNTAATENGLHILMARAYDAAGNIGQSANVAVNVINDTIAPSISISSPIGGAATGTVQVLANATDNVAVSKVEFYINGALQATSTSAPYGFTWNTASFLNGSYTLSAKAYDPTGNVGQSANVAVNVYNDTTAPSVSISSPTGGTAAGTVLVAANATDNVAVARVEFYVNGVLQATSTSAPYGFSWNTSSVADGSYTLSAKAYDASGNVGQSANVAVDVHNVIADTTAPSVTFLSPTTSSIYDNSVNVSASAADNVGVTKMELYVDGNLKSTSGSGSLSAKVNLGKGSHSLTVKAYDTSNNVGSKSVTVNRVY